MTTVQISDFRAHLSDMTSRTTFAGKRYCVQRNGKAAFAVVPVDDMLLLEQLEDKMDLELAAEAIKRNKFVSAEELTKKLKL